MIVKKGDNIVHICLVYNLSLTLIVQCKNIIILSQNYNYSHAIIIIIIIIIRPNFEKVQLEFDFAPCI